MNIKGQISQRTPNNGWFDPYKKETLKVTTRFQEQVQAQTNTLKNFFVFLSATQIYFFQL